MKPMLIAKLLVVALLIQSVPSFSKDNRGPLQEDRTSIFHHIPPLQNETSSNHSEGICHDTYWERVKGHVEEMVENLCEKGSHFSLGELFWEPQELYLYSFLGGLAGAARSGRYGALAGAGLGFSGAVLQVTGYGKALLTYTTSPMKGAISGAIYGSQGSLLGALIGSIDEGLIHLGVEKKPHLVNTFDQYATAVVVLPAIVSLVKMIPRVDATLGRFSCSSGDSSLASMNIFLPLVISIGLQGYQMYPPVAGENQEEEKYTANPVEILDSLRSSLVPVMGEEAVDHMVREQTVVVILSAVVTQFFLSQRAEAMLEFVTAFNDLKKSISPEKTQKFYGALTILLGTLGAERFFDLISSFVAFFFDRPTIERIQDKFYDRYVSGETPMMLSYDENAKYLVEKMDAELDSMTEKGVELLKDALKSYVSGVYHFSTVCGSKAADVLILKNFYSDLTYKVTAEIEKWIHNNSEAQREIDAKITNVKSQITSEAKNLVLGDQVSFASEKYRELLKQKRERVGDLNKYDLLKNGWMPLVGYLEKVLDYSFYVMKFERGDLIFDDYPKTNLAVVEVSSAMKWSNNNVAKLSQFKKSQYHVDQLRSKIDDLSRFGSEVEYKFTSGDGDPQVTIRGLTMGYRIKPEKNKECEERERIDGEEFCRNVLLRDIDLVLDSGIYAVTGASGSGKSSFISKLQGIKHDGIWASGTIEYVSLRGRDVTIYRETQKTILLKQATLLENILSKSESEIGENIDLRGKVKNLLEEIEIGGSVLKDLNKEKNWANILSGGQKKKIAVVRAILRKPDILVFDEIFAGMDAKSVRQVQGMIRKYFPGTLILVVDHEMDSHNMDGFFDFHLHLNKNEKTLERIDLRD